MQPDSPIAEPMGRSVVVNTIVPLEVFTIRYALAVLKLHKNKVSPAARALGVSRHALTRLRKRALVLGVG